jgi:dTDP-4-amino-4,6-dideoxygalactose transaminase
MPAPILREELIARMKADGIMTPFHYVPLHTATGGARFARISGELTRTEDLSARLVRLPLFPRMGDASQQVLDRLLTHLDQLM